MEKFRYFQTELKGKIFCEIFSCQTSILTSKFVVVKDVKVGKNYCHDLLKFLLTRLIVRLVASVNYLREYYVNGFGYLGSAPR